MACFLVPMAEAVVVTVARQITKKKELKIEAPQHTAPEGALQTHRQKTPLSKKLSWLQNLLWGGSILLAFEHLWHGEIVPYFPFLTNASNAEDLSAMLHEMATVGVGMAVAVTAVWGVMVAVTNLKEKKIAAAKAEEISE